MAKQQEQAAKKFTVGFLFEKETPGTYRFAEVGEKDQHKIGTIYIKKGSFREAGMAMPPKGIKVTVEEIQ